MKILTLSAIPLSALLLSLTTGCQVGCIEDGSGTTCTAKSLERFDGQATPPQLLDRAPGQPITIDVLYGNVLVQRAGGPKVEVQFLPFVYAGHGEHASANQQLAQNLRTSAAAGVGVVVSVRREGGSNGLGADTVVRLPDSFDGPLTIVNHGGGPINNFDVKVEYAARATALSVTNHSQLGTCWVQGAPSVHSTTVQCTRDISVLDVSDEVNINALDESHDSSSPAVTLRMAAIVPGTRGGRVTSASGAIVATFPRAGGYVLNAKSPFKGFVQEGALPPNCAKQEAGPNAKTVTCGNGPAYELIAGAKPNYIGPPEDSNVQLSYR
jgi:hypothetical protein